MTEIKKAFTKPPKPPVVATEPVKQACGHVNPFELFAPKQDKFRDARRAKFAAKRCKPCNDADQERRHLEAVERKKNLPPRPSKKRERFGRSRLPHRSAFAVAYNASLENWSGTLTVPGFPVIPGQAATVFTLLVNLDSEYRRIAGLVPEPEKELSC